MSLLVPGAGAGSGRGEGEGGPGAEGPDPAETQDSDSRDVTEEPGDVDDGALTSKGTDQRVRLST